MKNALTKTIHPISEERKIWRLKNIEHWDIYMEQAIVFPKETPIKEIFTEENLYATGIYDKEDQKIVSIEIDTYTVYVTYLEIGEKGKEWDWEKVENEWTAMSNVAIFESVKSKY